MKKEPVFVENIEVVFAAEREHFCVAEARIVPKRLKMIEAGAGQSWPGLPEAAGDAGGGRCGRNGIRGGVW